MDNVEVEQAIEKIIDKMGADKSDHFLDSQRNALKKVFIEGQTPCEAMGFNDDTLEGMYSQAYQRYKAGKYEEAGEFFKLLINLDPTQSKFSLGLAACYHMQNKLPEAIESYMLCYNADNISPIPLYHMSDCWIKLDEPQCAIFALEAMLSKAGESEEFGYIVQRAKMTLETLKKEVREKEINEEK